MILAPTAKYCHLVFGGNCLTNDNVWKMGPWLDKKRGDLHNETFTRARQQASSCLQMVPGMFHVSMHQLNLLYNFFYGGFMQPVQTLLGWRRIRKDVTTRYQYCACLATLMHEECTRLLYVTWLKDLVSKGSVLSDVLGKNRDLTFEELHMILPEQQSLVLAESFHSFV
jgi:hypothetical protein